MSEEVHKRLTSSLMTAIAAAGEMPEGTLRDRMIGHLFDARTLADQILGTSGAAKVLDSPMASRMS